MRKIDSIIIHCTATPEGRDCSVDDIRRWHIERGWSDIGYHYVIHPDGKVDNGRPVELIGAHCKGHNSTSIGVSYIGGCGTDGITPKDTRTEAQKASLIRVVRELMTHYRIPSTNIYGHHDFDKSKPCPSFDVQEWKRRNSI